MIPSIESALLQALDTVAEYPVDTVEKSDKTDAIIFAALRGMSMRFVVSASERQVHMQVVDLNRTNCRAQIARLVHDIEQALGRPDVLILVRQWRV